MRKSILKINSDTWDVDFYENDQICPKEEVNLSNHIASQFKGYNMMYDDLKLILNWLEKFQNQILSHENDNKENKDYIISQKDEERKNNLFKDFCAIIILYGRLFSENEERRTRLDKQNIPSIYISIHN